ncbi:MAG: CHRD domain-containing protein [Actinobacteria bacterium]|nr:CHRD domain-containing protein [Actinomycetota bacterium]
MKTSRLVLLAVAVAALTFAGLGTAASQENYKVKAMLTASQETPAAKSKGTGVFTAKVVEKGSSKTLTWKLTFKGLTGAAQAAHIHLGKRGVAGPVAIPLCGPCKSGASGTAKITQRIVGAFEHKRAYVNVHTAKYPNGEIRGQVSVG